MSKPLAIFLGACFLVSSGLISAAAHAGDAAAGKKVLKKCKACHYAAKDKNKTGPHLVNLIGREAGTVEGYKYSKAMKSSGIVWDEDTLTDEDEGCKDGKRHDADEEPPKGGRKMTKHDVDRDLPPT